MPSLGYASIVSVGRYGTSRYLNVGDRARPLSILETKLLDFMSIRVGSCCRQDAMNPEVINFCLVSLTVAIAVDSTSLLINSS